MNREIERKFLVDNDEWAARDSKKDLVAEITQAILSKGESYILRVRHLVGHSSLTIKSRECSVTRYENIIPIEDSMALDLLLPCENIIRKKRYRVSVGSHTWDVDEFLGHQQILAEIELNHPDEKFDLPDWAAEEVTGNPKYYNQNM